jgi:hypothetical protein
VFTGKQVVYIYHDQIDTRGENSEDEVFVACEEAVSEIAELIRKIAVNANTLHFIVTADHGFLYKRDKVAESGKIGGVSEKMLAQTLQWLEADGFVLRVSYPVVPPHVEYSLTPLGNEVALRVRDLADWVEVKLPEILQARAEPKASARPSGGVTTHRLR